MGSARINHLPGPFSVSRHATIPDGASGSFCPQIMLSDPDYFYWGLGKGAFRGRLDEEAAEIGRKSCSIKIPKSDPENWRIEYQFTYDDKFAGFSIIDEKSAESAPGNSKIAAHLDLSLPRRLKKYDKFGNELMLGDFRDYYFDGGKLTKEFFLDDGNFLVG